MGDSVGKRVVHVPTGRVGVVRQETPLGAYVEFPDGSEYFFPFEELKLYVEGNDTPT